jgi:hypothetical protein
VSKIAKQDHCRYGEHGAWCAHLMYTVTDHSATLLKLLHFLGYKVDQLE